MFTCSACLRRALRNLAIATSNSPAQLTVSPLPSTIQPAVTFVRSHATYQSISKGHHRHDLYKALEKNKQQQVTKRGPENPREKKRAKDREAREHNRLRLLTDSARADHSRAMQREAKFLVDPLKLAETVVTKLKNDDFNGAIELVRASEKALNGMPVDNVVSWNHIIDWLMSQNSPSVAWKVFNEMKKRGHKPDAHSFTILLRGYRDNVRKPNAVKQAVDVYNSMSAANSAVVPTTIHTNAVLSVCAQAHDIDALWTIAGKLPERGPGAPDHVTFTTILQALSAEVRVRVVKLASERPGYDVQPLFNQVIDDARRLWVDITARWRRGDLHLDEALVCAMGRVLMLSTDAKTQEDVFNLVQQTMNISRPSDGSAPASNEPKEDIHDSAGHVSNQTPSTTAYVPMDISDRTASSPNQLRTATSSVYTVPGRNTLSMLVETTTALRHLRLGKYYWELLTSSDGLYRIIPDAQNITAYLRLLRVSRASQAALDILRTDWPQDVQDQLMARGTFIIAMSTCIRDKNNPNVFDTASHIMDLMQSKVGDVINDNPETSQGGKLRFSPKVLKMYLELAMGTTQGISGAPLRKMRNGDLDFERDPSKNNTLRALKRLGPDVINVKQLIKYHLIELEQQAATKERTIRVRKLLQNRQITPYSVNENIGDLFDLLRSLISAYDKILRVNETLEDDGMGPLDSEVIRDCWTQKRKLSAFVGKINNSTVVPKEVREANIGVETSNEPSDTSRRRRAGAEEAGAGANPIAEDEDNITLPTHRIKLMEEIQNAHAKRVRDTEQAFLSRRQKQELLRTEAVRAQFPASVLRRQALLEESKKNMERRARWDAKMKKIEKRRSVKRGVAKEGYDGWGGGFAEMARENKDAGFVDLGR